MKKYLSLFITFLFLNLFGQNQFTCYYKDSGKSAREHLVDFQTLTLKVKFDTLTAKVIGNVIHQFIVMREGLDSLILDAVKININQIKLDGKPINDFYSENNQLIIKFSPLTRLSTHNIEIDYTCQPKRGLYFIGWNDSLQYSKRQIWTQGQGIDNRQWIPMFDDMSDKITTDITITFDKKYKVLSNGVFLGEKNLPNNLKEWHYKMNKPHAPYLIMLGIGDYKIKQVKSKSGVNINLWYYPEKEYCVPYTYRYSAEMMDFLEKETGIPYPWENYSQIPVQEYMYGAMENTTATVFGDFFLTDEYSINDRDYLAVNGHELAHQWFGDCITARSTAHVWLQESFATHYNWLVEKDYFGQDHYDWIRKSATDGILKESEKNLYPIVHSEAGSTRIYPKGAYVLHMIKYILGKKEYDAGIKRYLQKHAYQNVETKDLWLAFYEETGVNLDWFFDEWLYRGGEPHYTVSFDTYEKNNQSIGVFKVSQTQPFKDNVNLFKMPIVFEIDFTDGSKITKQVMVENKDQIVEIPFSKNKNIGFVLFDPNSNILKKVSFTKSLEMLKNQVTSASNLLDRYDAVIAMRNIKPEDKRNLLIERFSKETHHSIKSEIVFQLINDTLNTESLKLIHSALQDKDTRVVNAVISNTKKIPSILKEDYYKALQTKSYNIISQTMWLLFSNYPTEYQKINDAVKSFNQTTGKIVEITTFAIDYLSTKNTTSLNKIILYASPSFEFRTRINAFNALVSIDYYDTKVKSYLEQAINSANNRLAEPAKDALKYFEKRK